MKRVMHFVLRVAAETESPDGTPEQYAQILAEDVELLLPSVCVVSDGLLPVDWPCATVTAVAVDRASEQEAQS